MKELAITARAAQLIAHQMHNEVTGCSFFSDHEFLGELYGTYEGIYDDVIERMIGLGITPNISEINRSAMAEYLQYDITEMDCCDMFETLLGVEENIRKWAEAADKTATYGSRNFLQGIADDSEKRVYKLKQRTLDTDENIADEPTDIVNKEVEPKSA